MILINSNHLAPKRLKELGTYIIPKEKDLTLKQLTMKEEETYRAIEIDKELNSNSPITQIVEVDTNIYVEYLLQKI